MAYKGTPTWFLLTVLMNSWIIYMGALDSFIRNFKNYDPCYKDIRILIVDGNMLVVEGYGVVYVSGFVLDSTFYIPH